MVLRKRLVAAVAAGVASALVISACGSAPTVQSKEKHHEQMPNGSWVWVYWIILNNGARMSVPSGTYQQVTPGYTYNGDGDYAPPPPPQEEEPPQEDPPENDDPVEVDPGDG